MAQITTNAPATSWSFSLSGIFRSIGNGLIQLTEANSRVRRAEALHAMNDEELAKMGLKREDIARHVFGDLFFI